MEDVTKLISKVSQELGPDASDEKISEKCSRPSRHYRNRIEHRCWNKW